MSFKLTTPKTPKLEFKCENKKREEILEYFESTFDLYEALFNLLTENAFYLQPDSLRQPLIFYYGHTAVFFINKLIASGLCYQRIDPEYETLFSIGVDEYSFDDDLSQSVPKFKKINLESLKIYRRIVRDIVKFIIRTMKLQSPITLDSSAWVILMGIEHERIHLETSSVLFRQLSVNELKHSNIFKVCPFFNNNIKTVPINFLIPVPGAQMNLGKSQDCDLYGWDNEYGSYTTKVSNFSASAYLVSNAEYYAFMKDGGYNSKYWSEEGKKFLQFLDKCQHPKFWIPNGDTYKYRTMCTIIDMPWDWPVDVNNLEAQAFCNWKSEKTGIDIKLPTEAQWHALLKYAGFGEDSPDWKTAPGNINLEHYCSSAPINTFKFSHGFYDIIGNVWQHTCTPITPFDGFKVHPVYDDFSTPTFDGAHNLIKGGSFISTGNESTKDARYAFRRHFYQHAGFRYVS
jgi:5-histidylcysteine sulfoxide synthase